MATLYGVWDDEAGFVTASTENRDEAALALIVVQEMWKRLGLKDANSRIREVHRHEIGGLAYEDPADDCVACNAAPSAPSSVGV